jgi:hypothetical protein
MATLFNNVANTNTVNYVPVQATFDAANNFLTFIGPGGVPFSTGGGSLSINSTPITGGTSGRVLYDNAGTVGELPVTGTGSVVLDTDPSFSNSITVNGSITGYGEILLYGSETIDQVIAGSQTTGNLTIGGVVQTTGTIAIGGGAATGTLTLGRSTGTQTVEIATGINPSATKTINIGTGSNGGATNIAIGATAGTSTTTLNGKTSGRIVPRVSTTASSATPTINTDNTDQFGLTAQAVDITSFTTNLTGTPTDGQKLWIYIVGTAARAITWGASFEASTVSLPTTTVTTNRLDVGFVWNAATSKWRCVAVA